MAKLIVIEGLDGSGKETQTALLARRLRRLGYKVYETTFPNYSSDSSKPVEMYLNGEIGNDPQELSPYACSTFYTVDRYITYKQTLEELFKQDDLVIITDRYVSSNIIHQAPKIDDNKERIDYFEWLYDLEFNKFGLPRENLVVYLDMPIWASQELMDKRYEGNLNKKDIHESKVSYLLNCRYVAMSSIDYFNYIGHNWVSIYCLQGNSIRGISDISDEIIGHVLKVLEQ